jgi:hypothetical protein
MFGIENWVMDISERRQIETAGNCSVRRLCGYTVYAMHYKYIYVIEERIQFYRNKRHNYFLMM